MSREAFLAAYPAFKGDLSASDKALMEQWFSVWQAATVVERERCAVICETPIDEIQITDDCSDLIFMDGKECAYAIREVKP